MDRDGLAVRANLHFNSSLPIELLRLLDPRFSLTADASERRAVCEATGATTRVLIAEIEPDPGTTFVHSLYPRQVTLAGGLIRLEDQLVLVEDLRIESGSGEINSGARSGSKPSSPPLRSAARGPTCSCARRINTSDSLGSRSDGPHRQRPDPRSTLDPRREDRARAEHH